MSTARRRAAVRRWDARAQAPSLRILALLEVPAVHIAANATGILLALSGIALAPALAGAARVTVHHERHRDDAARSMLRGARRTWRRDLPVSLALIVLIALAIGDTLLLAGASSATRVLLVGMVVPALWAALAAAGAYLVTAAQLDAAPGPAASRARVLEGTVGLLLARPGRAVIAPVLLVLLLPVAVLAPLTIACGLSLPAWILARTWGMQPQREAEPERAAGAADAARLSPAAAA